MTIVSQPSDIVGRATPMCSQSATGQATGRDGITHTVEWQVPDEVPVALLLNSHAYTVMMATPTDLVDFGRGFVLAEGIVNKSCDVRAVLVLPADTGSRFSRGMAIDVAIDEAVLAQLPARSMEGRTGCGLCGVAEIENVVREVSSVKRGLAPSAQAILRAADWLPGLQPMNRLNRSVHAAAWVGLDGTIHLVREDVGRHNALDKLIGALSRSKTDLSEGFVLMTSRCSFELVQKCATVGIGALVTVSAPTALAHDIASASGMFMAALGAGGVVVFNP